MDLTFFFKNVGSRLANEIPHCEKHFQDYMAEPTDQLFLFQNITEDLIYQTLSKLQPKKSSSHDNISTKLLIEIMPCIIFPIIQQYPRTYNIQPSNFRNIVFRTIQRLELIQGVPK